MSSIYEQDIYSNGNRSGIFVWHVRTMYHRMQSSNLLQRDRTWSRNFATCPSAVEMPADSAELGHTQKKTN